MDILITKTKGKSSITCDIVNVWNLSAKVNDKLINRSYYGYTRCRAVTEFKKLIKN
jgi:hypothetical protein